MCAVVPLGAASASSHVRLKLVAWLALPVCPAAGAANVACSVVVSVLPGGTVSVPRSCSENWFVALAGVNAVTFSGAVP